MKKRIVAQKTAGNSFGVAALVFGVLSIIFFSFNGIILSILGIIFSLKQWRISNNKWVFWALVLSILGMLIGLSSVLNYIPYSDILQQPNSITP